MIVLVDLIRVMIFFGGLFWGEIWWRMLIMKVRLEGELILGIMIVERVEEGKGVRVVRLVRV